MKGVLTLTCYVCLRQGLFPAPSREAAHTAAKKKGWQWRGERPVYKGCSK